MRMTLVTDHYHEPTVPLPALQRQWEDYRDSGTDLQPTGGGGDGFDFTVMSYNILSQDLLHENAYLYSHCDPSVLPWDFRLPNLLREIRQYDADVSQSYLLS